MSARLVVEASAFTQNSAGNGGAINVATNGVVTLSDGCTLTENVATTKGGGLRIGAGEGYVSSTEFVDNDAPESPDAHKNDAGTLECTGCPGGEIDVDGCETVDFCQSCVCVPAPTHHDPV